MQRQTTGQTSYRIRGFFTDHPHSVDETYGEHFRFALRFAGRLLGASVAAAIHAVIPALCEKTASNLIRAMYQDIQKPLVKQKTPASGKAGDMVAN